MPGCNQHDMMHSLHRVSKLPASTKLFPGHMGPTTIGEENASNPFFEMMETYVANDSSEHPSRL